ncbi:MULTISPECIES: DEAD/DEAH box helicase [Mesorhizobium]|uniref:DEAD/DEAH box helicase n=1 Tax=Mesorhizobium TaxID=68287 RepID=UPI0007EDC439|nr:MULTISPECIES: DEAD/DEAH box helicase [Mesorhizobium]TPJ43753.1 DEAD/DEAH box helicase [Mesorhizobium sp. B2-6-6]ARP67374.1 peptidase C14 [Mesorhizobium sp. WSM1497]MCA0002888.1 caspase family protein [Mesorhizobium sp. B264B2A]MCA0009174.1 caspase family protein [Mesorhizobium sp. B264B1B]MCA0014025.1 caspase family protein [Mesorhizobium sp. B294B1A1]
MIRAAFIGINKHLDPLARELSGAVGDASTMCAVLSDSIDRFQPTLITDHDATYARVSAIFDDVLDGASEDDVVILFFAGHGTQDHRLVLTDTRSDDVPGTTIDMTEIAAKFRTSRARAVLLLLDCCFSGGAPARVLDVGYIPRAAGMPLAEVGGQGRILFAACNPNEEALEDPQTRHGLFTKAILDCILESDGPVSVVAMVDRVVQMVRANAARFGYEQTPVMFGHVEGELTLPKGMRGKCYRALYPERGTVTVSGPIGELSAYGIPQNALNAWSDRFPAGLNSLQIATVNSHGVLDGKSLLVVAPTSAGKTFVGEMAALKAIGEGKKAVFLLPYKALVNEKFEDFSALYGDLLNLRIARCSGDWQDQVGDVLRGKYDIAFFTYEKFLALSVSSPHILHQIGLVVIDEGQFITEPGRGMVVELILTNLLSARERGIAPQLVTLSAVIGDTNNFERWLDCELLLTTERPVPLTEGVIDRSGVWKLQRPNGEVEVAQLFARCEIRQRRDKPSSQDVLVPLVRHLAGQGEKVIVFRNARGPSAGCAEYLAAELGLPPAQTIADMLPGMDRSDMSERLRRALNGGVAFHNGDLNREERMIVERGFRDPNGGIQVLVATSTVAAGVNTPASTVIVAETEFRGVEPQPYTVAQYKNMAGRAGRLGYETEGKAIVLADTGMERENLFRRYVQGRPERIQSSFDERSPGTWVVRLLAQVKDIPSNAVVDLVANTYGGFLASLRDPAWRGSMSTRLLNLMTRMQHDGLIDERDGRLRLTPLGRACGESPLSLESSMQAVELLRQLPPDSIGLETVLVLLEALPERDEDYTPQTRRGEPQRQQQVSQRFGQHVARALWHRAESDVKYYGRCKRALIVSDWIEGVTITDIETGYTTNPFSPIRHGDIRGFADGTRFLLDSVLRIAAIVLGRADDPDEVSTLLKRLDLGIPGAAFSLTELPIVLARGEILELWKNGYGSREQVEHATEAELVSLLNARGNMLYAALHEELAITGS